MRYGAAYLYKASTRNGVPTLRRRLTASDAGSTPSQHFGCAIAMHNGRALIGSRGPDAIPAGAATYAGNGAVYLFDLVLGNQIAKIQPADNMVGCFWFGASLLLTDEHFWIGAPKARPPCALRAGAGALFVFDATNITTSATPAVRQVAKILPRDYDGTVVSGGGVAGCALCAFGAAIARMPAADDSDSFRLLVSAPGADRSGVIYTLGPFGPNGAGVAIIDGESPPYTIRAPTEYGADGLFGHTIAVEPYSRLTLITAPQAFTAVGPSSGGASLLRTWIDPASSSSLPLAGLSERSLWGFDGEQGQHFGTSVSIASAGIAMVGSPFFVQPDGTQTGAVYIYWLLGETPSSPPPPPAPPSIPPLPLPPTPLMPSSLLYDPVTLAMVVVVSLSFLFGLLLVCVFARREMKRRGGFLKLITVPLHPPQPRVMPPTREKEESSARA